MLRPLWRMFTSEIIAYVILAAVAIIAGLVGVVSIPKGIACVGGIAVLFAVYRYRYGRA